MDPLVQIEMRLREGEYLQRISMTKNNWAQVVRIQQTLAKLYALLDREPCVKQD